jgi:phosphoserine phosphatase
MKAAQRYADVFFDCDSTLSTLEGIDELARGRRDVAELTRAAMEGRVPLQDVYRRRLELVQPTHASVERLGRSYCHTQVTDAGPVLAALQAVGKRVHVISGGLAPAVRKLAAALHVPEERVHAVEISFDRAGDYEAYDAHSPLSKSGGKREYLQRLRAAGGLGACALVGDGVTDLEAAAAVDLFIGFGGVERRTEVERNAAVYVSSASLAPVLVHLCTGPEWQRLADRVSFKALLRKALELSGAQEDRA